MKRARLVLLIAFALIAAESPGQIPQTMSYQGVLTDAVGEIVRDGQYVLTLKLYETAAGGSAVWQEIQNVAVSGGIFNAILGNVVPLAVSFDKPYWLGVAIGSEPEMAPRLRLTASPYSLSARAVVGKSNFFPAEGNVGIGTTNPQMKLEVTGDILAKDSIVVRSQSYAERKLRLVSKASQRILATNDLHLDYVGSAHFSNSGTIGMKIHSSGNVGIGNFGLFNDPTEKLQVQGVIHSTTGGFKFPDGSIQTAAATGGGGVTLDQAYDLGGPGAGRTIVADAGPVHIDGTDGLRVNGNLGIGVTASEGRLHIESGASQRALYTKATGLGSLAAHFETQDPNNNSGTISIANNGGGVGLMLRQFGSDGRAGSFHINNAANNKDAVFAITTGTGNAMYARASGTGNALLAKHDGPSGNIAVFQDEDTARVVITKDGNVGIGTNSPTEQLHVAGNARCEDTLAVASSGYSNRNIALTSSLFQKLRATNDLRVEWGTVYYPASIIFQETNANGERLRIHAGGNVSIGHGSNPPNILTIKQNSETDPIADAWTQWSSRRWKENIEPIASALDKVRRLRGVAYDWKANGKHDIGLIAEEVDEVVPEVVAYEENGIDAKSVDYARLTAVLIEAVKEQQKQIEELRTKVQRLEASRPANGQ